MTRALRRWFLRNDLSISDWIVDLPVREDELRFGPPLPWPLFLELCARLARIAPNHYPPRRVGHELGGAFAQARPRREAARLRFARLPRSASRLLGGIDVALEAGAGARLELHTRLPFPVREARPFVELAAGFLESFAALDPSDVATVRCHVSRDGIVFEISGLADPDDAREHVATTAGGLSNDTEIDRLRILGENPHDLIVQLDDEGRFVYVSPNARELLGCEATMLLGRDCLEIVHPDDRAAVARSFRASLEAGPGSATTHRVQRADGETRWFETIGGAYEAGDQRRVALFLSRDVTDTVLARQALRHGEDEFRQLQKMEAIARLAGGVAHDFNNLLTTIAGYGDLLLEETDGPARNDAREIVNAARRGEDLTRQLLAFSRHQVLHPLRLDLNELVAASERVLRPLLGEGIEFVASFDRELWPVHADRQQLERVLRNLVANARDAISGRGRIEIETRNCRAGEGDASLPPGDWVRLSVRDDGRGMDDATRARVFEPFFTTREDERGAGLGLSAVYGIVRQSAGFVRVTSTPGVGSEFEVHLPRSETVAAPTSRRARLERYGGDETVLIVEDSDAVRQLVDRHLSRLGYQVLAAAEWSEADEICRSHPGDIDLLLTDVILPRVDGVEVARRVRELRPNVRVVYMSGFSQGLIADRDDLQGIALLEKPFTPTRLLQIVRECLDLNPPEKREPPAR